MYEFVFCLVIIFGSLFFIASRVSALAAFVWGCFGLSVTAAVITNTDVPFQPYFTLFVGMMSVLCMLFAYKARGD